MRVVPYQAPNSCPCPFSVCTESRNFAHVHRKRFQLRNSATVLSNTIVYIFVPRNFVQAAVLSYSYMAGFGYERETLLDLTTAEQPEPRLEETEPDDSDLTTAVERGPDVEAVKSNPWSKHYKPERHLLLTPSPRDYAYTFLMHCSRPVSRSIAT